MADLKNTLAQMLNEIGVGVDIVELRDEQETQRLVESLVRMHLGFSLTTLDDVWFVIVPRTRIAAAQASPPCTVFNPRVPEA